MQEQGICRLLDKVSELVDTPENKKRRELWDQSSYADQWRGIPTNKANRSGSVPVTLGIEYSMWSKILDFDLVEFFTNPTAHLEGQLRIKIHKFQNFSDDTPIDKTIYIFLGTSFEVSLFGLRTIYKRDQDPWIDRTPIFDSPKDIGLHPYPSFRESGMMPLAHRMFERITGLIRDDFSVIFPTWMRGPFGVAVCLRGMEDFLTDMLLSPSFAHRLLEFVTESRKRWDIERAKFLGVELEMGMLDNDDVNSPNLSPKLYEGMVLPYEKELHDFYGGISYWHSCGNIAPLIRAIRQIPKTDMLQVGPWTDLDAVLEVFGESTPLEVCLHPMRDVYMATQEDMISVIRKIMSQSGNTPITIRADTFQEVYGVDQDIERIKRWVSIAQRETR